MKLRTIQRLESGAKISTESLRARRRFRSARREPACRRADPEPTRAARDARGRLRGLEFTGTTSRTDFWWFALAVVMVLGLADLIAEASGPPPLQIASLVVLLPWIAACTRRLRDAGLNPWWQLISLAPVGGILVLLYLLTYPTRAEQAGEASAA